MKKLILLISLLAINVNAASFCTDLFKSRLIESFQKSPYDVFLDLNDARASHAITLRTPEERIKIASDLLGKQNVNHQVVDSSHFWSLKKHSVIKISTEGDSFLNKMSHKLFSNYGVTLVYDTAVLEKGTKGAFFAHKKIINISNFTATTGEPDLTLLHEIRHASMTSKEKKGQYSLFNGSIIKWKNLWPWGKTSNSAYKNYMSLQEVSTWLQGLKFQLISLNQLSRFNKLTYKSALEKIEKINFAAMDILKDSKNAIEYQINYYRNKDSKKPSSFQNDGTIFFGQLSWGHFFSHNVPSDYVVNYMNQKNITQETNLKEFFKTKNGKVLKNEIILSYLEKLRSEIVDRETFILNNQKFLNQIKSQLIFGAAQNRPITEFKPLFEKLGKTSDFSKHSIDQNIQFNYFSNLPKEGLDFSKLKDHFYKSDFRNFNLQKNSYDSITSGIHHIMATFESSPYIKFEFDILDKNNTTKNLVIEASMSSINKVADQLQDLSDLDFKLVSVRTITYNDQDGNITSKIAKPYAEMNDQEMMARNLFRIQELIEN